MKTILICSISLVSLYILIFKRKTIRHYLNKEVENIKDLNIHNEEIAHFISIYEKIDSAQLVLIMETKKADSNEFRAIQKILKDRNAPLASSSHVM